MGNQDSKADASDSDSEKNEQYTHHIKVFEQVSKPASSGSDSGGDDAYHSGSDHERADVSRQDESESMNDSDSFSEVEEEESIESVEAPEEEPSSRVTGSEDKEQDVKGRIDESVKGSDRGSRFMERQVKPILGFIDSSENDDDDLGSEDEILMEIDKCLETTSSPSSHSVSSIPKTGKTNRSPRNQVATSSPTSRMIDMVSVEAPKRSSQAGTAGGSVKRKISDVEPEVITNADVRSTGGSNRPFKGSAGIPDEQATQKQPKTTRSTKKEGHRSPKQFEHFTNSPFRTNNLLKPAARHVGVSEQERIRTPELVKAAIDMSMPKSSLVSAVLDAKENTNSQKLQDEKKSDQHPVVYTQKQKKFPKHLLKEKNTEEMSSKQSPTLQHFTLTPSTSVHDEMDPTDVGSGNSQQADSHVNESKTSTTTVPLPVSPKVTPSPVSKDRTDPKDVQFGSGPTFSSYIYQGKTTAVESVQVSPKATSSPIEEHGARFGIDQTSSSHGGEENVGPASESLMVSSKASPLPSTQEQIATKNVVVKFGGGHTVSTNTNERVSPSTISFSTQFKGSSSSSSTENMPNIRTKKPENVAPQSGNIDKTLTQTTAIVSPHVASSKMSSAMTSTEDLFAETQESKTTDRSCGPAVITSPPYQFPEISLNMNRIVHTASVGSQTFSSVEHELPAPHPASGSDVMPVHVPMATQTSSPPEGNPDYESGVMTEPMDTEYTSSPMRVVPSHGSGMMTVPMVTGYSSSPTQTVSSPGISVVKQVIPQHEMSIKLERFGSVLPPRGNVPSTRNSMLNASVNKTPIKRPASPESTEVNMRSSSDDTLPTRPGTTGFQNYPSQGFINPTRPTWSSFADKQKTTSSETAGNLVSETANVETMRNPFYAGTSSTPENTSSIRSELTAKHSSVAQNSNEVNVGMIGQKPSVSAGKPVSLATPRATVATPFNSFARSHQPIFPSTISSGDYTRKTDMVTSNASRPVPSASISRSNEDQSANFRTSETASHGPVQTNNPAGRTGAADRQSGEHAGHSMSTAAAVGRNIMRSQERLTPAGSAEDRFARTREPQISATKIKSESKEPPAPPVEMNPLSNKGDKYTFELADDLKIHICYGDLVEQTADAIVNSTDGQLTHVNRTSMSVAAAAGNTMINQCQNFLRQNGGPLEKAQVFNTVASGTLVGKVSHILHVPAPTWIVENETQSCNDLLKSLLNCLTYANDHLKLKSIAFPLVGTDYPADACINAFFKAMLVFVFEKRPDSQLRDISVVIDDFYLAQFCLQMIQSLLEQILLEGIDGAMAEAVNSYYGGNQWERQQNDINQSRLGERVDEDATVPMTLFRGPAVKRPKL
ncbi:cell wall protein RBR3-like [Gigantopelta aegis]|uniref:cell wall protein RBR3-like n=1 Tax=Gigantopelta aegis TaxID=1735272 RepID=UPI001B889C89|nr:cell wall protein RBR3-like [Gigantopelta aegis]